ncbi:hypothetical protein HII36_55205 [Nonomuraea sp. NN258]|uniref:hypothetical protein n=1 Tax=Nonomuraea antri TaxID=2730852 RepID=UPI00156A56B3|nr:hypothetical protein [Nonomuraea antri]NRQ40897.1 hypothetical protein [Nonomuraea antri]
MPSYNFEASWKAIAIGSILINFGSIATIATMAATNDAGALNTIALALAVIAFICQLIIFTIQTSQSGSQLKQAERLNSETSQLLAEMRTRIEGTHQMVSSQYQELLHLAALKSVSEAAKQPEAPPMNSQVNLAQLEAMVEKVATRATSLGANVLNTNVHISVPRSKAHLMSTWPSLNTGLRHIIQDLKKLPAGAIRNLALSAGDEYSSNKYRTKPGLSFTSSDQPLIDHKMAEIVTIEDAQKIILTPRGRLAGRLLLSAWPPPETLSNVKSDIEAVRNELPQDVREHLEAILE